MIFTKFHKNRLIIIDGEINEKHALLVSCGLIRYNVDNIYIKHVKEWVSENE